MSKGYSFKPVSKSLIDSAFRLALYAAQEQILTDCNTYIKYDEGTMEDSGQHSIKALTLSVTWDTPYARRQWYTGEPSKKSKMQHPKASIKWAEKAEAEYRDEWIKILEKGMNKNL